MPPKGKKAKRSQQATHEPNTPTPTDDPTQRQPTPIPHPLKTNTTTGSTAPPTPPYTALPNRSPESQQPPIPRPPPEGESPQTPHDVPPFPFPESPTPPLPKSSPSPNMSPTAPPVLDLLNGMRDTITALSRTFESLQGQHDRVLEVSTESVTVAQQVHDLRVQLVKMDSDQERSLNEVKEMIRDVLVPKIAEDIRNHLRDMIKEQVAVKIRARVAAQLQVQFPQGLEETLADHRKGLLYVKQSLHNAEARRSNGLIRSNQLSDPLQPILRTDGSASPHMPMNLTGLFSIPDKTLQGLMKDYDLPYDASEPRERAFNRMMQFLGVAFQMVPSPSSAGAKGRNTPLITGA